MKSKIDVKFQIDIKQDMKVIQFVQTMNREFLTEVANKLKDFNDPEPLWLTINAKKQKEIFHEL